MTKYVVTTICSALNAKHAKDRLRNSRVASTETNVALTIKRGETTVLVLTGTGLKASERIGELLKVGARSE